MMQLPDQHNRRLNIIISLAAAMLFIPFLGGVHLFDWDEINFAESAREMIASGDYLTVRINFVPFWEKPPLFIWMQVLSMKVFGINEFAARFPNAICGMVSLPVLFNIGRRLVNVRFGLLWTMFYAGSLLPFFYFKSGIIDPWFNLFIFLGFYYIYLYFDQLNHRWRHAAISALFIGLAILTKGPVALLVFLLSTGIFIVIKKFRISLRMSDLLIFFLVLAFTGGFWFILQIAEGNFSIIEDFVVYQIRLFRTRDAGHGGFLFYHFVVLFAGVFPASVFALPALLGTRKTDNHGHDFYLWMRILFWVVLLLFTLVKTKIVHYSSLCYFPLTFIAAWSVYHALSFTPRWKKFTFGLVIAVGLLLTFLTIGLAFFDEFKNVLINSQRIADPFALACMKADGGWNGYEITAGLILLAGLVIFSLFWIKAKPDSAIASLTLAVPLFMFAAMLLIVPRVEQYSQAAAIEFFKSVKEEDAYLETVGFKSYAHLFYGQGKNHVHQQARDEQWLLTGDIDKNAYFALKINRKEEMMRKYPDLEFLYEKNGFAFFKRTPRLQQ